jgi:hypothetical protein
MAVKSKKDGREEELASIVKKKLADLDKNELVEEVKQLREQNIGLEDEKESLWAMLDEISASDIENWGHILDQLEETVSSRTLIRALHTSKTIKD